MKNKILIKGNFSEGNFGDDALLLACHQLLTNIGLDTVSLYDCNHLYYSRDLAKNAQVGALDKNNLELVLYAGGTQFFSFSSEKSSFLQNFKRRLAAYKWLKKQRAKYAMIGVGLGPFKNGLKENIFVKTLIRKSSFIWVRDKYSYKECESSGITDVSLGSDLCFLSEFQQWCNLPSNSSEKINKIGIVLRDWRYEEGNEYIGKIIELSQKLKNSNYELAFYLFSVKEDVTVENILLANEIPFSKWDADKFSFKEFLSELNTCDLFITARYHSAIFSMLMQKPFITVGLDQKLTYLSSQFENDCFNWNPKSTIDELLKKVNFINENYFSLKQDVIKTKAKMEDLSNESGKQFSNFLLTVSR